uniref:Uncharacterized protein n=1 Tax=Avena sativa TaxID=4498 RepID=A0ACD5WID8_AVESA
MSTNHTIKVTFFLADPPAVSYFCVHGPELKHAEFRVVPRVVFSVKHLVLLRFAFTLRPRSTVHGVPPVQYFVYKAAHGQPSLTPIPTTRRPNNNVPSYPSILPFEGEDGNFLVADLATTQTRGHYVLHIFSSKKKEWTARPLQLQLSPATKEDLPSIHHKVIALGAGTIGWIDLWRGIIVCNVFDPDPVLRFIPLPKPAFNLRRDGDPRQIRDVTCFNGIIKFIEMEHYPIPVSNIKRNFKTTQDLDTADVLYDSELFFHSYDDVLDKPSSLPSAWKIRTCYRHTSWQHWCKGLTVHVDDILVNDPSYYVMLPELWDGGARKFTLANLTTVCPTLSIHGGNVVYLVSRVGDCHEKACVVGVDLQKKTVEMLEPYKAGRPFLACTFSGYLNTTPRPCAPEDCYGQNYPLNGYLTPGNIIQSNLRNMHIVDGYSRSSIEHGNFVLRVNRYLFQPQLVVPPHGFPQTLQHNFTQSGSVLNTIGHGQPWPSMSMDNRFQTQMTREPVYPAMPQMHLVPADSFVAFDRFMHAWIRAQTSAPFNEPQPVLPPAAASNTPSDPYIHPIQR